LTYSIIGIIASIILWIINRDVLWNREAGTLTDTQKCYRNFPVEPAALFDTLQELIRTD